MNYEKALLHKEDFLTYIDVEKNSSLNTYKSYQYDLNQIFTFWKKLQDKNNKQYRIQEILDKFFIDLYNNGIKKSSIARKIACLKSFEKYMHINNIEIYLRLTTPKIEKKLPTYLTIEEINYLLDTVCNEKLDSFRPIRDKTILETLYATGIRCSELCNIKLLDINFDQKTILITGKGDKQRIVLFGDKAKNIMLKYISTERAIDATKKNVLNLFLTHTGSRLQDRTVQRILNRFSKLLGSKKQLTPHKIRHSFATHLLNAGMNLRALQELLGHSSLATTEKYTHISAKDLKELYTNFKPLSLKKLNDLD